MLQIVLIFLFMWISSLTTQGMSQPGPDDQAPARKLPTTTPSLSSPNILIPIPDLGSFHHINLDFSDEETAASSNALLEYLNDPGSNSSRYTVHEASVTGYPSLGNWNLLSLVFDQLTELETVHWDSEQPIPASVLHALEAKNPSCRLRYTLSFSNWDPYDEDVPWAQPVGQENNHEARARRRESIIGSKVLYALKAPVRYGGAPNADDMDLLFRTLASCPNLKELDISIEHFGCVFRGDNPYAFDFISHPDVVFPPLEVLKVDGYRFDARVDGPWRKSWGRVLQVMPQMAITWLGERHVRSSFANFNSEFWPESRESDGLTNLDWWLKAMDWSHLHTLDLTSPSNTTLGKLSGDVLPNLRTLALDYCSASAALEFIAKTTVPLESLSLQSISFCFLEPLIEIISTGHSSLKSLSLNYVHYVGSTDLSSLLHSCTQLQHLSIDVKRTEEMDYKLYDIIASAPEICSLTLRFPSPDAELPQGMDRFDFLSKFRYFEGEDWEDEIDPIINQTSILTLFKYLRSKKIGKEFKTLDIFVGAWENRNKPRGQAERLRRRVAMYRCEADVDGKETCEGSQTRNTS